MPNRDRNPPKGSTILLKVLDVLKKENDVTNFLAMTGKDNGFIVVELNHVYNNNRRLNLRIAAFINESNDLTAAVLEHKEQVL